MRYNSTDYTNPRNHCQLPAHFSEFIEIRNEFYQELYGEGKHHEKVCINLRSHLIVSVKYPMRNEREWRLWPKPLVVIGGPCPAVGCTYRVYM